MTIDLDGSPYSLEESGRWIARLGDGAIRQWRPSVIARRVAGAIAESISDP